MANSTNINELSQSAKEALVNFSQKEAVGFYVNRMKWVDIATSTTTYVSGPTIVLSTSTSGATLWSTRLTNPDFPRAITIVSTASPNIGGITFTGTDLLGGSFSETLTLNHLSTVTSVNAFNTITAISIPTNATTAGNFVVGVSASIGLNAPAMDNSTILGLVDGTRETTAPVITSSPDTKANLVSFSTAPNGSRDLTLYYISQSLL